MDSFLKINNCNISYSDIGSGDVILFIHGWMDSRRSYEHLTSILSKKYRCVSIDLPGFGKSSSIKDISLSKISYIVYKFIKKIKIDKFYIVGHSLGGSVSIVYTNNHPETIKKLVLISPFISYSQFPKLVYFSVRYLAPYLFNKKILEPLFKVMKFFQKVTIEKKIDMSYVNILKKEKARKKAVTALKYAYQFNNLDLYSILRKIRKDTLLVYGTKDSLLSLKPLEPLFGILTNIHLAIYEDVRHYILSYNHEDLAKKIDLFFRADHVE